LNKSELNKSELNKSELSKSELNKSELSKSELSKSEALSGTLSDALSEAPLSPEYVVVSPQKNNNMCV
jgi:uncharacterized protein YjbI with pentapeptide repeats